jgi:6-phosphogluconolactonase (cycloisomerase 2 family)
VRRGALLAVALLALGCGGKTRSCKHGTVLLDITLEGSAADADHFDLTASVGGSPVRASVDHSGAPSGTLELDFSSGTPYSTGASFSLTLDATMQGRLVGTGLIGPLTLPAGCAALSLTVTPTENADAAADQSSDLENADLTGATDLYSQYTVSADVSGLSGVGLTLQNNGGDDLPVATNGHFSFATPVANGGAYAVSVSKQPTLPAQTCTVTNGAGMIAGAGVSVAVHCQTAVVRFAYVANFGANTLSEFIVDANNGQLRPNGTIATGNAPETVAVDPTGRFLYTANASSGPEKISAYTIDAKTGKLTSIAGVTSGGESTWSIAIEPTGRFAYTSEIGGTNLFSEFAIDQTTGALSSIGTVPTPPPTYGITIEASGRFLYGASTAGVVGYSIDATSGKLTSLGPTVAVAGSPFSVAVDPSGRFVYAGNQDGTISSFAINASSGALSAAGTPVTASAGNIIHGITADPTGKYVYAAVNGADKVFAFAINQTTGALTSAGTALPAGMHPDALAVDPSGRFVFVPSSGTNDVRTFRIDGTSGAISAFGTVPAGASATSIALVNGTAPVVLTPRFAYVANSNSNNVSIYSIDATTGALTPSPTPAPAGTSPSSVAVDPTMRFVYVSNFSSNNVSMYTINANGTLSSIGTPIAAGTGPNGVSVDPTGRFVYVPNVTSNNVSMFAINPSTGALSSIATAVAAGAGPQLVAVDPVGRFAYAPNNNSSNVSEYTITSSGALSSVGPAVAGGNMPNCIALHPLGGFAYLASWGPSDLRAYSVDGASGALTSLVPAIGVGTNPSALAIDPSGTFLAVTNSGTNDISIFSLNPSTGALTSAGSVVGTGSSPTSMVMDPSGKFAWVLNYGSNDIWTYALDAAAGTLTKVGNPVGTGSSPLTIAVAATAQ